jgi:hypothetical protein
MTIVTCDHSYPVRYEGEPAVCGEEFRSCSDKAMIPKQLEIAKWTTRPSPTGGANHDICPFHSEASRWIPSQIWNPNMSKESK